jgi:phytoene synthase
MLGHNAALAAAPAEEMARFAYSEADLFAGTVYERFVALMRFQIERARALYRDAEPGIARLVPESRYAVRLALHLYRGILDKIEANGYDVFDRRAFVPLQNKIRTALALGWVRLRDVKGRPAARRGSSSGKFPAACPVRRTRCRDAG